MENENPSISRSIHPQYDVDLVDGKIKDVTREAIFQLLRGIKDPEYPYSLEQLSIISLDEIYVEGLRNGDVLCSRGQPVRSVDVVFTPTVPHCSMAGIIGLTIIYKLMKFTKNYMLTVRIKEGTHSTFQALNKQLSDKDRVFAAFENEELIDIINLCIGEDFTTKL